jgi:glycosyltransferase involved in cell wall biosynthesis
LRPAGVNAPEEQSRRLGTYIDAPYRVLEGAEGARVMADPVDQAFLVFACEVGKHFEELILFGRLRTGATAAEFELPLPPRVSVAPLPDYPSLAHVWQVLRATAGTVGGFWRGLARVDVVWVFGPHPFALVLVVLALARRKRVVLGVRQEPIAYFRTRLPGRRRAPLIVPAYVLAGLFRLLARRLPATVVGSALARRYRGGRAPLLAMTVSVVPAAEVVAEPPPRSWDGVVELLTVGRIEPEKNPLLLAEALARLERLRPGGYRASWVGDGRLADDLRSRAAELGVARALELPGFVPPGQVLGHYRRAHAFVHVALTEGVPQVLVEALASGLPLVATDVGGVRTLLADGEAGLLVPPGDADALAAAVERLAGDRELRERLAARGLELARTLTLEGEAARVAAFLARSERPARG